MQVIETSLPGALILEPKRFGDVRGFFVEMFHAGRYASAGMPGPFVQDNLSRSAYGVLRGLHLQYPNSQSKLVSVLRGRVLDVAVDVRIGSPSFGKHVAVELSDENGRQFFVPRGFAHGFVVLSDRVEFLYKTTDYYAPEHERTLLWNDPKVGVEWPLEGDPVLKPQDAAGVPLARAETFP